MGFVFPSLQGSQTPQFLLLCAEFPEWTRMELHPETGGHQLHKHCLCFQVVGSLDHFPSWVGKQRVGALVNVREKERAKPWDSHLPTGTLKAVE